jgi:hypothetical protein
MKRIALLPAAVSVLSTILVACGSGGSEEVVQIRQDSAQTRRLAGEQWAKQQEQKARADFNSRGGKDPIYSRLSSPALSNPNNQLNGNSQPNSLAMSQMGGNSESSTGDLLKMGAVGLAMMAITQGFNGEKLAGALGMDDSKDSKEKEAKEKKTTENSSAPQNQAIAATTVVSNPSLGTKGVEATADLSVSTKDAREYQGVKFEEVKQSTDETPAANLNVIDTKPADEAKAITDNAKAEMTAIPSEQEPPPVNIELPAGYKIVFYDLEPTVECESVHETNGGLSSQVSEIFSKASVTELGGSK